MSLTGSGGKTTLMFALASEFVANGERVLLTTTTKIARHEAFDSGYGVIDSDDERIVEDARRASQAGGAKRASAMVAFRGHSADGHKLLGFSPEAIARLRDDGHFDRILVEADGSARRPLKAPAPHEPVIPASTDVLIMVAGLNGLGLPLDEATVFRADRWAVLTGAEPGSRIDPESLARVALHKNGLAKDCPERARQVLFLNRSDTYPNEAGRLVENLMQAAGRKPERVVCGCLLPKPEMTKVVLLESVFAGFDRRLEIP